MNDAYDATTLLDKTVPLGELLYGHLARVRTIDYAEDDDISETDEIIETENFETPDKTSSPRYELPVMPEGYVMDGEVSRDFLACKDRDLYTLPARFDPSFFTFSHFRVFENKIPKHGLPKSSPDHCPMLIRSYRSSTSASTVPARVTTKVNQARAHSDLRLHT